MQRDQVKNQLKNLGSRTEEIRMQDIHQITNDTKQALEILDIFLLIISCIAFLLGFFLLLTATWQKVYGNL